MALYDIHGFESKLRMIDFLPYREDEFPVAAGQSIDEEGLALAFTADGSVQPASNVAGQRFAGFAKLDERLIETIALREDHTVPAVVAGVDLEIDLEVGNLVVGQVYCYDVTAGAQLPVIAAPAAAVSGSVVVDHTAGTLLFHADEAEHDIFINFKFSPTVTQLRTLVQRRHINQGGHAELHSVTCVRGPAAFETMHYDASLLWAVGDDVYLGASGQLSNDDNGGAATRIGNVQAIPAEDNPFLRVDVNYGA